MTANRLFAKNETKITSYDVTNEFYNDFVVEIVEQDEMIEAWLYHRSYCVKSMIIGCYRKDYASIDDFLETISCDIANNIGCYIEEYCD